MRRFRKPRRRRPPGLYTYRNPAYREWRTAVLVRDNSTCQLCHRHQTKRLQAHHIKPKAKFPELGFTVANGIMLCKRCHKHLVNGREGRWEGIFEAAVSAGQPVPYPIFVWFNWVLMKKEPRLCECGCGAVTKFYNGRYSRCLRGHRRKSPR